MMMMIVMSCTDIIH